MNDWSGKSDRAGNGADNASDQVDGEAKDDSVEWYFELADNVFSVERVEYNACNSNKAEQPNFVWWEGVWVL